MPPSLDFRVNSFAHDAIGGPKRASITVYSEDINSLWEMIELLRCPVEISDEYGRKLWWGYVSEATVRYDAVQVGVSLDPMFNRISVTYMRPDNSVTDPTGWGEDLDSQAEYGIKESYFGVGYCEDAQALVYRDERVRRIGKPVPKPGLSGAEKSKCATLICRGWWDTLEWRYYSKATTASVETTTQIANIVTGVGPFLTATDIDNASGISGSEYRKGDRTALKEIETLLAIGVSGGRRLLATVGNDRRLRIYQEPDNTTAVYLNGQGNLENAGNQLVDKYTCPCGIWAILRNIIPGSVDLSRMADASQFFIEESEYVSSSDRLNLTARDTPLPGNFTGVY